VPFILVSGQVGEESAAALMRAGAHDFVLKDRPARLVPAILRELHEAEERAHGRQAQAALRDSEERFRLLAEHAQDVIFRYRLVPEPRVEYISPAVIEVTGYQPAELYADAGLVFAMVEPDDRERFESSWRSPDPPALVVRWRRRDGRLVWMEQRAVGITDPDGRLIAVEGILRDVTDQLTADQERERLDRELRHGERLDSLGRLAGGIAHDFNNLLAVITLYAADVAAALPADHPVRSDVEKISHAAERAAALTRQLLMFSRLDPSLPETLDVNAIVTDIERLLHRTIGEDIEFQTRLQPGLRPVTIDRSKIEQVIVNLVMNARAAMPHGGHLHIETADVVLANVVMAGAVIADVPLGPTRQVRLTVTDTGCGMSPEVAQRAFEPFFTTKGPGQGTGLGLATAYGAIKEAGGDISLRSEPGRGTTVEVLLPAADSAVTKPEVAQSKPRPGVGEAILVVEDETAVREIVVRVLTRSGYQALPAATAKEALKMCANPGVRIDALLTDVIMPEMSGPQLVERVRDVRPALPALLMSGYTAGSLPGAQELGANLPLIRKPFDAATLLRHVRDLLAVPR
jgi:PAS domain S-box-containing protein